MTGFREGTGGPSRWRQTYSTPAKYGPGPDVPGSNAALAQTTYDEIIATAGSVAGEMVAILPYQSIPRRVSSVSVSCTSASATNATVHLGSTATAPLLGTSLGNGDTASDPPPIDLAGGTSLVVRWINADANSSARAIFAWVMA